MTIQELSTKYIQYKEQLDSLTGMYEKAKKTIDSKMDEIKQQLTAQMSDQGLQNMKTNDGLFYFITKTSVTTEDKEAFFKFVQENNAYDLLQRTPLKTGVLDYIKEHESLPPGVKYTAFKELAFRKG